MTDDKDMFSSLLGDDSSQAPQSKNAQASAKSSSGNKGSKGGSTSRGRGLASADQATRQRVASMGGKASHGGGRKRKT